MMLIEVQRPGFMLRGGFDAMFEVPELSEAW
jgi:hypothetical protein